MEIRNAIRKKAKIKMALQGASGTGKTYSALLLAFGLAGDWESITLIDTENNSADLYAHLGCFKVISLDQPYTPERYLEALELADMSGAKVVVIDSLSHEWEGSGGIIDTHSAMPGNSFTNWAK